jgi:hypothetical protein
MRTSFSVNGAKAKSMAGPLSGLSLIETPPPGKMATAWPCFSH